jgi:hypothetical protein
LGIYMLDSPKPLNGGWLAYIRFPLHGCPRIKNVFGIAPSPASVNVPKSLHHSTRGTSGFVLIQFVSRIMSSSVIDRSLTRSSRCPRTAFGNFVQSIYGTGQSLYSTPNTSFSICFHWRCDVLVSPSLWKLRIICRSFRSLASPTRSTNASPD